MNSHRSLDNAGSPISLLLLETSSLTPFDSRSNSRSAPLCKTVLLVLPHTTSRPAVPQYHLYLVVPPFGLGLWVTCLSLRLGLAWLSPGATVLPVSSWTSGPNYLIH